MKVLFTARKSLFSQPGGDTQQVQQTAEALRDLGHKVDIVLNGEDLELSSYDLVHFFNFGRPADLMHALPHITQPLVVSSIWVDYSEYDQMRTDLAGKAQHFLGHNKLEYAKALARGINSTDAFPPLEYLTKGHQKSMRQIAQRADVFIASSQSEKMRLDKKFGISGKTEVVPLGLAATFWDPAEIHERKGVISVGRIEGLKNQLNLIKAAANKPWQLAIIGKPALNQMDYFEMCKNAATKNVHFAGWRDGEHLLHAYRTAKVLVLPSYFETYGLVALEALSQGCQIVLADRHDMNSIFEEYALFFNPNDPEDMAEKIEMALKKPVFIPPKKLREKHQWAKIAQDIEGIYAEVLAQV